MLPALIRRVVCSGLKEERHALISLMAQRCFASMPEGEQTVDFGFKNVPRERKVDLVGQVFSSVASSYDIMNDLMSGGMHRLWKDNFVAALAPFPGMHHLDVAGGTGDVAFRVLRAIRRAEALQQRRQGQASSSGMGSVTVCDINPDMLKVGQQKAKQAPDLADDPGLAFVEGNAEELPFDDDSFDGYTIAFGIRNITDRDAALREAFRVLKPGGRFLCLEFSQVQDPVLRQLYDLYSFNVIPKIGGLVARDEASYQYLVESIRQFPSQDDFADMIEDAGFLSVGYENILGGVVAMHTGFKL